MLKTHLCPTNWTKVPQTFPKMFLLHLEIT